MSYPEHEKLQSLCGANQIVGHFISWLEEHGYEIAERHPRTDQLMPAGKSRDQWIAAHFEIDSERLEWEKQQMLEKLRG